MPKPYNEFRYDDWEWIAVHFPPAEREDMARTAWLIAQCSSEEIEKHQNLDPRIVIPLCAIEFQDEIDLKYLKTFNSLKTIVEQSNDTKLKIKYNLAKFIIKYPKLGYEKSPENNVMIQWQKGRIQWQKGSVIKFLSDRVENLFSSININLQIDLLERLINNDRLPNRNDWRYLFEEVKYEFKTSWHYKLVLFCVALLSFSAISEMIFGFSQQSDYWINGLVGSGLYVVVFWLLLWQDPNQFIALVLLGLWTFPRELYRLLRWNPVLTDIEGFFSTVSNMRFYFSVTLTFILFVYSLIIDNIVYIKTIPIFLIFLISLTLIGSALTIEAFAIQIKTESDIGNFKRLRTIMIAFSINTVLLINSLSKSIELSTPTDKLTIKFLAGFITVILTSIGITVWRLKKQSPLRFLAILSFPLFCSFPIVVGFATKFFLRFFSWQFTLLIWLISLGTCTALWMYGQNKERQATNPLKGILDFLK